MKQYYIQLSKDFPLAYKEMEDTDTTFKTRISLEYDSKTSDGIMVPDDLRDLYDWFDGIGVYISILAMIGSKRYSYSIDWCSYNRIETRSEAEREAFTKAFEVREEQLKLKQK